MIKRAYALLACLIVATWCGGHAPVAHAGLWGGVVQSVNSTALITSMTAVSIGGGTTTATGVGLPLIPKVVICMSPCSGDHRWSGAPLLILSATSAGFVAVVPPMTAGTYDVQVSDANGVLSTQFAALLVDPAFDCLGVFSTHVEAYYKSKTGITCGGSACANGGSVDKWADQSSHARDLTAAGSARPTYLATSSFAPSGFSFPGVSFDAVANVMSVVANIVASTDLTLFLVAKETATNTNKIFMEWAYDNTTAPQRWALGTSGNTPVYYASAGPATTTLPSTGSIGFQLWGGMHGTSGSYSTNATIDNSTALVTGTSSQTWGGTPTTATIYLGAGYSSSTLVPSHIEVAEMCLVSGVNPTAQNYLDYAQYQNLTYLNYAPSFAHSTETCTTSAGFRIRGTGAANTQFVTGVKVSFPAAVGVSAQTATVLNSQVLDVPMPGTTLPSGAFDLTITNPDGGSITQQSGFHVAASNSSSPGSILCDNTLNGWYSLGNFTDGAPAYTLNGLKVSCLLDQSLLGNDECQATSALQPACSNNGTSCTVDTDFASAGISWSCDGTSTYLTTAANAFLGAVTPTALDAVVVGKWDAANLSGFPFVNGTGVGMATTAGKPVSRFGGHTTTYGTAIGGATHEAWVDVQYNGSPANVVNVDNGGSPVSASPGSQTVPGAAVSNICAQGLANYWKGKMVDVWTTRRTMTSTEQGYAHTRAQSLGAP